jgi:deoxyribodipyrimidine photo-lyase
MVRAESFPRTRAAALARLSEFLPSAPRYAAERNHAVAGHPHVSRLSPAVRYRLMSEAEILDAVLAVHAFPAVEKFVQEVVWRTYWKGWLELRPGVWKDYCEQVARLRVSAPGNILARAAEVTSGRSGVAIMDRFVRELIATGYLHNHARMWFASFWIHVEHLPWALGADFFHRHLLDADPASNTLSWRWVAGLQTKGKTYLVRRSNLEKYADPSWLEDPAGLDRLDDAVVSAALVGDTADLSVVPLNNPPARPESATGRFGFWLHSDDLSIETSDVADLKPISCRAFLSGRMAAALGLSPQRESYLRGAMHDAVSRASVHFGCPAEFELTETLPAALARWAQHDRLETVVAFDPFVGPLRDTLPAIRSALLAAGIQLVLVRRPYDAALFPLARSGYFGFWERAQAWLKGAGTF